MTSGRVKEECVLSHERARQRLLDREPAVHVNRADVAGSEVIGPTRAGELGAVGPAALDCSNEFSWGQLAVDPALGEQGGVAGLVLVDKLRVHRELQLRFANAQ